MSFRASLLVSDLTDLADLAPVCSGPPKPLVTANFHEKQATFSWQTGPSSHNKITNCVHFGLGFTHYTFSTPNHYEKDVTVDDFERFIPPKHVCKNAVINYTIGSDGVVYCHFSFSPKNRANCSSGCRFCGKQKL